MSASTEPSLADLRRDRLLIWLWVPAGMGVILLATRGWSLLIGPPSRTLTQVLCVLWVVTELLLIWRHSSRRCPDCGHRYLRAYPWMSLRKVRCPACGYQLK